ncbi:hypothetical protein VB005_09731 [Metarhizium brunneum]
MSGSRPRHNIDRFLEEEELADRMLKVAGSTQDMSTAKVAEDASAHQAEAKTGKGKTDGDWVDVQAPGASGGTAAEGVVGRRGINQEARESGKGNGFGS